MSTPQARLSTPASAAAGNADVLLAGAGMEYPGEDMGRVSGRCHALKQAPAAVDAYVSGQRI